MTLLLVAAHQVVTVVHNHTVKLWNLVGRVLQVGIHRDDNVTLCLLESAKECRRLAVVAAELDALDVF